MLAIAGGKIVGRRRLTGMKNVKDWWIWNKKRTWAACEGKLWCM